MNLLALVIVLAGVEAAFWLRPAGVPPAGPESSTDTVQSRFDPASVQGTERPTQGAEDAPVVIVEFSSFRCHFCAQFHDQVLPRLESEYLTTGEVRFVFRHLPTAGGDLAAEATECAREQGRFWEMHDLMFERHAELRQGRIPLRRYARDIGMDGPAFDACLSSRRYRHTVERDRRDAAEYGVPGTPTFFINGRRVVGFQSFEVFQEVIEAERIRR